MPSIVVILALLGAIVWALYRNVWLWFWGAWFFLILAPTSSIVPIADLAFEHRMYLPLAGVVVIVVIGVHEMLQWGLARLAVPDTLRRGAELALFTIGVLMLAFATIRRNDDYRSEYAMWTGIVANRPHNPRAHYNQGNILDRQGKLAEAKPQFSEALRLKPDYADAHVNLGAALLAQNKWNEAVPHLSEAVRVKPNSAEAHTNLGTALFNQGQVDEAIIHFSTALRINPGQTEAKNNLDIALARKGPPKAAMK
jgi:tetratricopeptide (TPR) repeat protein